MVPEGSPLQAPAHAHRRRQRGAPMHEQPCRGRRLRPVGFPERPEERSSGMPHDGAKRIRNVALVGHRGSGKTSLNEALLFEAGAINRLGTVADGTTVSDSAPDEQAREMSIASSLTSFRWQDRKINLIDTPGEPSFVADALAALRVCEGAVFVVNGVMGVEVGTDRLWQRAADLGPLAPDLREHARPRARRLLPHPRVAQGGLRPARGGHRDPDRRRARAAGRGRPDRHEGLPLRRRRPRQLRGDRHPRGAAPRRPRSTARS